jgi:hypothetical protein
MNIKERLADVANFIFCEVDRNVFGYFDKDPKCIYCNRRLYFEHDIIGNELYNKDELFKCKVCNILYVDRSLKTYHFTRIIDGSICYLSIHVEAQRTALSVTRTSPITKQYKRELICDIAGVVKVTPYNVEEKIKKMLVFS